MSEGSHFTDRIRQGLVPSRSSVHGDTNCSSDTLNTQDLASNTTQATTSAYPGVLPAQRQQQNQPPNFPRSRSHSLPQKLQAAPRPSPQSAARDHLQTGARYNLRERTARQLQSYAGGRLGAPRYNLRERTARQLQSYAGGRLGAPRVPLNFSSAAHGQSYVGTWLVLQRNADPSPPDQPCGSCYRAEDEEYNDDDKHAEGRDEEGGLSNPLCCNCRLVTEADRQYRLVRADNPRQWRGRYPSGPLRHAIDPSRALDDGAPYYNAYRSPRIISEGDSEFEQAAEEDDDPESDFDEEPIPCGWWITDSCDSSDTEAHDSDDGVKHEDDQLGEAPISKDSNNPPLSEGDTNRAYAANPGVALPTRVALLRADRTLRPALGVVPAVLLRPSVGTLASGYGRGTSQQQGNFLSSAADPQSYHLVPSVLQTPLVTGRLRTQSSVRHPSLANHRHQPLNPATHQPASSPQAQVPNHALIQALLNQLEILGRRQGNANDCVESREEGNDQTDEFLPDRPLRTPSWSPLSDSGESQLTEESEHHNVRQPALNNGNYTPHVNGSYDHLRGPAGPQL